MDLHNFETPELQRLWDPYSVDDGWYLDRRWSTIEITQFGFKTQSRRDSQTISGSDIIIHHEFFPCVLTETLKTNKSSNFSVSTKSNKALAKLAKIFN